MAILPTPVSHHRHPGLPPTLRMAGLSMHNQLIFLALLEGSSHTYKEETFWRIPAKLTSTQLRRLAASLNQREKEEGREQEPEAHPGVPGEQSPDEEPQAEAPRAFSSARKKKAGLTSPEVTSEEETTGEEEWKPEPKKRQLLDSDEEEDEERRRQAPALGTPVTHKKKRFQIEDDDEDD